MHIALDLTPLQRPVTGCDRYMLELLGALAALGTDDAWTVFVNRDDGDRLPHPLPPTFRVVALPFRGRAARLVFQQGILPVWLTRLGVDVLHSPSFFVPLVATRARHVVTVHDLTFFTAPALHDRLRRSAAFRAGLRASMRRADRIVVPSHAVAGALREVMPAIAADVVRVVPHGVAESFAAPAPDARAATLARLGLARPYLLHVGTVEPRKNVDVLLDAWERLRGAGRDLDLVLAGRSGWNVATLERRLAAARATGRVHHLGYVADADLPALYASACLCVFPSAYEGFGLPSLEAMACGAPVLASDAGALGENLDGAAARAAATPSALAAAIASLLDDPAARAALAAAGTARARAFRWDRAAAATLACYRELAAER